MAEMVPDLLEGESLGQQVSCASMPKNVRAIAVEGDPKSFDATRYRSADPGPAERYVRRMQRKEQLAIRRGRAYLA